MKARRFLFWLWIAMLVGLAFVMMSGCSADEHLPLKPNGKIVKPTDFGDGVYFFHLTGATFGSSLHQFLSEVQAEWELIGTDAENDKNGQTVGHWVYLRKKAAKKVERKNAPSIKDTTGLYFFGAQRTS